MNFTVIVRKKDTHTHSWPTVVEGDPKFLFSIATTPRYTEGRYSFLLIAPLTLDPCPMLPPYLYICSHPQTDWFVALLFSVAKHVGHLKLGSKPAQLYVRLSIIALSLLVTHVSLGIIRYYIVAFVYLHFV